MGEKLQNLKPREAESLLPGQPREAESLLRGLRGLPREAKPYTRAKWEIRFQRFALSFRLSAKVLVFGLSREVKSYTRGNEKFHFSLMTFSR
jgi:hypothetical protein